MNIKYTIDLPLSVELKAVIKDFISAGISDRPIREARLKEDFVKKQRAKVENRWFRPNATDEELLERASKDMYFYGWSYLLDHGRGYLYSHNRIEAFEDMLIADSIYTSTKSSGQCIHASEDLILSLDRHQKENV